MPAERALFDAHCHLSSEKIPLERRVSIVRKAQESGVEKMVVTATDLASLEGAFSLQQEIGKEWIKVAAAMPPHDVSSEKDDFLYEVRKSLRSHKLDAIGETGLEYFQKSAHLNPVVEPNPPQSQYPFAINSRQKFWENYGSKPSAP